MENRKYRKEDIGRVITLYTNPGTFSFHVLGNFVRWLIRRGKPCIYFSSERLPWMLAENYKDTGYDILRQEIKILNLYNSGYGTYSVAKWLGEKSKHVINIHTPEHPVTVLGDYGKLREKEKNGIGGIFDSVPSFVNFIGNQDGINFFRSLITDNKVHGDTFLYKIQKGALPRSFEASLEELSDLVLELEREDDVKMMMRLKKGDCSQRNVEYELKNGNVILKTKKPPSWAAWADSS